MRMRQFEKAIKKDNVLKPQLTLATGTITTLTSTTGNITTGNITNAVVSSGIFNVLRIPLAAHALSGSIWVSGNGSYLFVRGRSVTASAALA